MAKICAKCGKKIGILGEPYELNENTVLCDSCAAPVSGKIAKLYGIHDEDEFHLLSEKIMDEANQIYDQKIVLALLDKISYILSIAIGSNLHIGPNVQQIEKLEKQAMNHMLTTGFDFYGCTIKKYMGIVSGEVVLGTGFLSELSASFSDLVGEKSDAFANKLEAAKDAAIKRMIHHSIAKGGNAIIGVSFNYVTFSGNMIGVVANGTSVELAKNEESTKEE